MPYERQGNEADMIHNFKVGFWVIIALIVLCFVGGVAYKWWTHGITPQKELVPARPKELKVPAGQRPDNAPQTPLWNPAQTATVRIDGCQYLVCPAYYGNYTLTHKGNCDNHK